MTDQHPLTDAVCDSIASPYYNPYGVDYDDLRAAADWQLQQVINWLNTTPHYHCPSVMAQMLQEAMRPTNTTTTQENN